MKRLISLLLTSLAFTCATAPSGNAQHTGLAYFALPSPKFPCRDALRGFEASSHPALAILWGTFGKDTSCLTQWFKEVRAKPHILEIHLSNEACRRNKRCSDSDFLPMISVAQLNKRLETRDPDILAAYRALIREVTDAITPLVSPTGEYILSTGLEDNFSVKAYTTVLELVREVWPHKVVRSAVGQPNKKPRGAADYNEGHGRNPQFADGDACIANLDGDDIVFPHRPAGTSNAITWTQLTSYLNRFTARCHITFLWAGPWQGLTSNTFTPPAQRNFEVSRDDIDALRPFLR